MRLIILFVGVVLAVGVFFLTMQYMSRGTNGNLPVATPQVVMKEVPTTDIYVAKENIEIGAQINPKTMLDIQAWPKHLVLPDMVPANPNEPNTLDKMVVRTPFQKGEPILITKLANEKDPSFLAASLPKGMRVVTIGVDPVSGVGGFVFPGDRVDVLVTHDIALGKPDAPKQEQAAAQASGQSLPIKKDPVTEILLSNIRVMAVNLKSTAHGGEPPMAPTTISLEVSPGDAQKLRLTENGNGRISLALRSLQDKDDIDLARPTGVGDLSRLTPPAYFPVLYDSNGKVDFTTPKSADIVKAESVENDNSLSITVVRGVKAEAVEVNRP